MEMLDMLAHWETTIPDFGAAGYFNWFFDFFPDHPPPYPNSTLTDAELEAITVVHAMVDKACEATSDNVSEAELVESGWPQRIAPHAYSALALMAARGRYSEDVEEEAPSFAWS
jgi:hypothetical protein